MYGVPLTLLHAMPPGVPVWALGYQMAPLPMDYGELQEEDGRRILEAARRVVQTALIADERVDVCEELVHETAVPTLVDASKDARMIVVGSRGQGAWHRALLGSVSTGLIHHAHCPVAVIRDPAESSAARGGPVVVGIDGSNASELATTLAFDEARCRGTELIALHAWLDTETPNLPQEAWTEFRPYAERTLTECLASWTDRYPEVTVQRRVVFDQPARHLLEAAESAQLVVVGSHGRGGFAGMLVGSVSNTVVHEIHTPVIVARHG
jgi:nucleotide-binding universal stress UspA family protein